MVTFLFKGLSFSCKAKCILSKTLDTTSEGWIIFAIQTHLSLIPGCLPAPNRQVIAYIPTENVIDDMQVNL